MTGVQTCALPIYLACPPCNIGPLSTPAYTSLADAAVHSLGGGRKVFAGQRARVTADVQQERVARRLGHGFLPGEAGRGEAVT